MLWSKIKKERVFFCAGVPDCRRMPRERKRPRIYWSRREPLPLPPGANILKRVPRFIIELCCNLLNLPWVRLLYLFCQRCNSCQTVIRRANKKRSVVPLGQINHKAGNFACSHSPDCPFSLAATAKTQAAARPSFVCCVKFMYNSSASVRFSQRVKRRFVRISEAKCC